MTLNFRYFLSNSTRITYEFFDGEPGGAKATNQGETYNDNVVLETHTLRIENWKSLSHCRMNYVR
jgi:hypothetical protein